MWLGIYLKKQKQNPTIASFVKFWMDFPNF